jgi:hypothetical protein
MSGIPVGNLVLVYFCRDMNAFGGFPSALLIELYLEYSSPSVRRSLSYCTCTCLHGVKRSLRVRTYLTIRTCTASVIYYLWPSGRRGSQQET